MKIKYVKNFNTKSKNIEDVKLMVIKENLDYVEGIKIDDKVTEDDIRKICKNYRKYDKKYELYYGKHADNMDMLKKLEEYVEYYSNMDLNQFTYDVRDQIFLELKNINDSIRNLYQLIYG